MVATVGLYVSWLSHARFPYRLLGLSPHPFGTPFCSTHHCRLRGPWTRDIAPNTNHDMLNVGAPASRSSLGNSTPSWATVAPIRNALTPNNIKIALFANWSHRYRGHLRRLTTHGTLAIMPTAAPDTTASTRVLIGTDASRSIPVGIAIRDAVAIGAIAYSAHATLIANFLISCSRYWPRFLTNRVVGGKSSPTCTRRVCSSPGRS